MELKGWAMWTLRSTGRENDGTSQRSLEDFGRPKIALRSDAPLLLHEEGPDKSTSPSNARKRRELYWSVPVIIVLQPGLHRSLETIPS
jgi:hypothetical protein